MDEFRAPDRSIRGNQFPAVAPRTGVTQTPLSTNMAPPSGVNPSLLAGLSIAPAVQPVMPAVPATPVVPAVIPATSPTTTSSVPTNASASLDAGMFSMPASKTTAQEAAVVTESAAAAQGMVTAPGATSFDIATITDEERPKNRLRGRLSWRKWGLGGAVVGLSLLIGTGGLLFAQGFNNAHKVFRGTGQAAALSGAVSSARLKGEATGRVNILLLGNGGIGHEAPDLTDTMILASIDTVHKTATMLSIPRDLWVQMPGSSPTKINAAYEIGKYNSLGKIDNSNTNTKAVLAGFTSADQAVQTVLGVPINYNVLVNFTSFKQAVDAVGGVTLNVPETLYDPTMAAENGGNPVLAAAGTQILNGTKALQYVRSRETSSDFARSQRQRSVILALKDKVLTAGTLSNPVKINNLLGAFGDNLVTDMSLSEGLRAYSLTKDISNSQVQNLDLVTPPNTLITTGTIQNASIDLPRAGLFSYADIQKYVQSVFNPAPAASKTTASTPTTTSNTPETAQLTVLNGTARAGLASTQAAVLKAAGYNVVQTGNAPTQTYTKTVIVDLSNGANPKTKQYLEAQYGATALTQLPDAAIPAGSANFVVILGSDQVH